MDANTPATQPFPPGDPTGNSPIQDSPIHVSPIHEGSSKGNPGKDNPGNDNPGKDNPGKDRVNAPSRPKGPNASAIVVGLVAMVLAGLIIANETIDLRVDWSRLGPGAIVGVGVVMVVLGAVGLVRRHDDV